MKIGPVGWIIIAVIVGLGVMFGLHQFGLDKKIANAAAPMGRHATESSKPVKIDGKNVEPLRVCINTWGGFAPGWLYNKGFSASNPQSRYITEQGIAVQFILEDNFVLAREGWKNGKYDLLWSTADVLGTEVEGLLPEGVEVFHQIDRSDGGDIIWVVREIKNVNDLRGKTVALAIPSPSSTLLMWVLKGAGMTMNDVIIKPFDKEIDAVAAFKAGKVQAVVLWSPDNKDCEKAIEGSHELKSTFGTTIIEDCFYVTKAYREAHPEVLEKFLKGWFAGVGDLYTDPTAKEEAAKIMSRETNMPLDFCENAVNVVHFSTLGDNINFFDLNGDYKGVKGEDLYRKTGAMYAQLQPKLAPDILPPWRSVTNTSIIQRLLDGGMSPTGVQAAEHATRFEKPTPETLTKPALASLAMTVHFATGSAVLDDEAKSVIDAQAADLAKAFRDSPLRLEGNTDSDGSAEINRKLSWRRAQSVRMYLVNQYSFDPNRIVVVGNGPDRPVADNSSPDGKAKNRRTDFQILNN